MILKSANRQVVGRIPEVTHRLRANCSKEWGCFVAGDSAKLSRYEAEKQGLVYGNTITMAIVSFSDRILTIGNFYVEEPFIEIWGFPIGKGTELTTFLLRSISRDKFLLCLEKIKSEIFYKWSIEEIEHTPNWENWSVSELASFFKKNVFEFKFTPTSSSKGDYFYVSVSYRLAEAEIELGVCDIASQIDRSVCNDKLYNSFEVRALKPGEETTLSLAPAIETEAETINGKGKKGKN